MPDVETAFDEESFLIGFAVGRMLWKPSPDRGELEQIEPEKQEQEDAN